jgi:hypothetical protein
VIRGYGPVVSGEQVCVSGRWEGSGRQVEGRGRVEDRCRREERVPH